MPDATRCFSAPAIPKPSVPGLSLTAPTLKFSFGKGLCCNSKSIAESTPQTPPIPIPPLLLMGLVEVLDEIVTEINAAVASAVPRCPRS
jgi:hypothetical protein